VEKAGGASSCDGKCVSALDVPITGIDQRTQVCFGSRTEVARFEHFLYGKASDRLLTEVGAEAVAAVAEVSMADASVEISAEANAEATAAVAEVPVAEENPEASATNTGAAIAMLSTTAVKVWLSPLILRCLRCVRCIAVIVLQIAQRTRL